MTRRDRGATSLEYVGVAVIAGLVIAAITLAVSPTRVGENMRQALCNIFIAAGIPCDASTPVDPRVPTEPCVISQDGWGSSTAFAFGVSLGGNRSVLTEKLSDGTYRVTSHHGGKVGAETGVGWDARVEYNGSSYGHDANAGLEAHLDGTAANVYVVGSKAEADEIERWLAQQDMQMMGATDPWGLSYFPPTDLIDDPTPTAVTISGGLSGEASAHLTTYGAFGADAKLGTGAVIGHTTFADGRTQVITKIDGTAQVTGNIATETAQLWGEGSFYTEETFDSKGNRTSIALSHTTEGANGPTITSYYLPITNQAQQDAATRLMWDPTYLFGGFQDLVKEQGQANRVSDPNGEDAWDFGLFASGKLLAEVGIEIGVERIQTKASGAEYWDGNQWVTWEGCS